MLKFTLICSLNHTNFVQKVSNDESVGLYEVENVWVWPNFIVKLTC
jgi:hypothetical protein